MDDLIAEFLTETNESLAELDVDLVKLEQNPNDKDLLSKIFRVIHTVKGTCGFLGLPRLEKTAHKAEDVLGLFRDGALEVTSEYVTLIFESLDRIKYIVGEIEANGAEPEGSDDELIAKLANILKEAGEDDKVALDNSMSLDEIMAAAENEATEKQILQTEGKDLPAPQAPEAMEARASNLANQSLRVSVDVIENLMTMVSELVLTRNQLLQILRTHNDSEFGAPLLRLNHVVSDLQEGVMKTRMQPIGNAWAKLPRIIRDISMELGKKIELEMQGKDTELDRQVLELIKDPLTHMVRNSGDHGIETPKERLAKGKPEHGTIRLNSYHEGGHIIIEIADDGKGLSTQKIKDKILANGLASAQEIEQLSTQQIQQYIFKAGFSTAEAVTSVSGRGVGMDVVRTNIEKIGGSIELSSVEDEGTTIAIKIPLTLAIVSALIVQSAGERFAIPQLTVKELVMTSSDGETRIEMIKGSPVFRLRDHLLPLVSLQTLLKLDKPLTDDVLADLTDHPDNQRDIDQSQSQSQSQKQGQGKYIIVMEVGACVLGVIVDRVFDTEEIVVKPVASILKDIDIFSGNTILGDGSVIMILDPSGIAKSSGDRFVADSANKRAAQIEDDTQQSKTALLLFQAGDQTPKAVPLALVSRLEDIKTKDIEHTDGRMVVQYRDSLMTLLPYSSAVSIESFDKKPVLVFSDKEKAMGLVVDQIIDIAEEHIDIKMTGKAEDMLGSAIIRGKTTDVINVSHFLHQVDRDWYKDHGDEPYEPQDDMLISHDVKRILLVEDSPFFRNMMMPLLKIAGYHVTAAENAIDALAICDNGADFDVILSDIEMPEMNGFEFAKKIKEQEKWQNIPMVALSSHTTQKDIDRGLQAGFSNYIAKFDRDTLLTTLSETLSKHYNGGASS